MTGVEPGWKEPPELQGNDGMSLNDAKQQLREFANGVAAR